MIHDHLKQWDDIKAQRDHACDTVRNAANCLGGLYTLLGNIGEYKTAAEIISRRDQCVAVLDAELGRAQMFKRELMEVIENRLKERFS